MYYPNGVMYPEIGMRTAEEDVLDLCVRKSEPNEEKRFEGDVNGNGYAANSNEMYRVYPEEAKPAFPCPSPEGLLQQRYLHQVPQHPDSNFPPDQTAEKKFVEDRVHPVPGSASPTSTFVPDAGLAPQIMPLPTPISSITGRNGKPTRPFKAYPKDFLALATSEGMLDDSNKRYMEFRQQFLTQLHATSGVTSNKNMKRPVQSDSPNQLPSSSGDAKDKAYWERRKKNNEAAKKSRDARRAKEDEIAIRAAFLERENVRLKLELATLRSETDRLRCMLYTS